MDLGKHIAFYHLELAQLWRCPVMWCTVWKGTAQDCIDHMRHTHKVPLSVKAANLAKYFPAWTVTRDQWSKMLMPCVSSVAIDTLLFSRVSSPLCHRYRLISRRTCTSLFNVSPLSPELVVRPTREGGVTQAEGVLLPTMLDDFNDSVLGNPIFYARIEQLPGSESPLSLPVYAWPSSSAFLMDSVIQTMLAPRKSERLPAEISVVDPPGTAEKARVDKSGLPGCLHRFLESMAMNRMSFSMMALGLGRSLFPRAEVDALAPAPRAHRAASYMSAMGLWHPQKNPNVPGQVPRHATRV